MPEIHIRQVEGQEMLDILFKLDNYAFRPTPPYPNREEWDARILTRQGPLYYALYEDSQAVAILACPNLEQNVRGKIFRCGGIADVSTFPSARRKGYSRQLLRYTFNALKDLGYAVSCLYPFRESFYERLGYVPFPQSRKAIFAPEALQPLLKKDLGGQVEILLSGEAYETYYQYVEEMQPRVHGMARFADSQKEAAQANRSWAAIARVNGEVEGIMLYSLRGEEIMKQTLVATRLYYRSSRGKYLLLEWVGRHIGQAERVELWLPPYEQPNTWFCDLNIQLSPVFVTAMGRVLEVAGLAGLPCAPGSFSAEVSDSDCAWNNDTWKFSGGSGGLQISRASRADCRLSIQGLTALVYGTHDPGDFPFLGWGEVDSGIQAVMREMFPPMVPYLHEYY